MLNLIISQKKIFTLSFIISLLFLPSFVSAQLQGDTFYQGQLKAGGVSAGLTTADADDIPMDPRVLAAEIIKMVLGVLGTFFVGLILLAGYRLIKADGESGKIDEAKETIRKAVIGLFIILMSYSFASFAGEKVKEAIDKAEPQSGFVQ